MALPENNLEYFLSQNPQQITPEWAKKFIFGIGRALTQTVGFAYNEATGLWEGQQALSKKGPSGEFIRFDPNAGGGVVALADAHKIPYVGADLSAGLPLTDDIPPELQNLACLDVNQGKAVYPFYDLDTSQWPADRRIEVFKYIRILASTILDNYLFPKSAGPPYADA